MVMKLCVYPDVMVATEICMAVKFTDLYVKRKKKKANFII